MPEGWNRIDWTEEYRITIHLVQKTRSQHIASKQSVEQSFCREWRIFTSGIYDFAHDRVHLRLAVLIRLPQNHRGAVHKEDSPQLTGFFKSIRQEWLHGKSRFPQKLCRALHRAPRF